MRQFVFATGFNASLDAASAGQLSMLKAGDANSKTGVNLVLKREDAKGGNILYPLYAKEFSWVKAEYSAATQFNATFTVPEVNPYLEYTVTFVKKGVGFNERNKWSAVIHASAGDTSDNIATKIGNYVNANKAGLGLTADVQASVVTVTGPATGEDYAIIFGDEMFGVEAEITAGKPAFMDAAMIKDLFAKAAADAGFEYTYDDYDIYPGVDFNPLGQPEKEDTGFIVYTLRFIEPRVMGTRDDEVYQIVQVAFPKGTTVTSFETELNKFVE